MTNTHEWLDDRIEQAIARSPYLSRKHLRLEPEEGRVVLRGEVGSYYQKQMAQEALRYVPGVEEIENRLEVCW